MQFNDIVELVAFTKEIEQCLTEVLMYTLFHAIITGFITFL